MKHFYVYYSYEEWGRGYIGYRGCKCLPEEDTEYFGSYKDESFHPTRKIVLATFSSREEAIQAEVWLHKFYDIARNPHFANKARQTSTRFTSDGKDWSGENNPNWGRIGVLNPRFGVKRPDEVKNAISKKRLGQKRSKESREKQANTMRGKPGLNKGRYWITNGTSSRLVLPNTPLPEGWRKGRTQCR
jgi:hypothetical protein